MRQRFIPDFEDVIKSIAFLSLLSPGGDRLMWLCRSWRPRVMQEKRLFLAERAAARARGPRRSVHPGVAGCRGGAERATVPVETCEFRLELQWKNTGFHVHSFVVSVLSWYFATSVSSAFAFLHPLIFHVFAHKNICLSGANCYKCCPV